MTLMCKIKKALNILSPAPYEYCSLKLTATNKKRCRKCKYFKVSLYTANEIGQTLSKAMQTAVESINKLGEAISKFNFNIPTKKDGGQSG